MHHQSSPHTNLIIQALPPSTNNYPPALHLINNHRNSKLTPGKKHRTHRTTHNPFLSTALAHFPSPSLQTFPRKTTPSPSSPHFLPDTAHLRLPNSSRSSYPSLRTAIFCFAKMRPGAFKTPGYMFMS
ncbi:hypothetical protein M758_4G006300 [Ceratodon purpureus]|nr:hypothetical protein M758_4G006300 [Ceratodon purpureus]